MRNQSEEILECIRKHPGIYTEDIVRETGWNRHLVEMATRMMVESTYLQRTRYKQERRLSVAVYG